MMECQKALKATDNDLSAAMDWLRKHGASKASQKVQGRETHEGLVGLALRKDAAVLVRVAAETDFASRSETFVELVDGVAHAILEDSSMSTGSLDDVSSAVRTDGTTVKTMLDEAIVAIRENLSVADAFKMQSDDLSLVGYIHNRLGPSAGTAAAVVALSVDDASKENVQEIGKKLAMHVVAARPTYMVPEDIPADIVQKEKEILLADLASTGKPPEILEKIVAGRLRKYYESVCLLEQAHMIEPDSPVVKKFLKSQGMQVHDFKVFSIN